MDEVNKKLEELEKKIDEIRTSVNKIKRVFFWTVIVSLALFILPLVGLIFAIPQFISTYSNYTNLLP